MAATEFKQYFLVKDNAMDYQYGGKKVSYEEHQAIDKLPSFKENWRELNKSE